MIDAAGLLEAIAYGCLAVLALAFAVTFVRLVRGPTLPDRVVALELITTIFVGIVAVWAVASGQTVYLDVGIVLALVGFLSAVAFARYMVLGADR